MGQNSYDGVAARRLGRRDFLAGTGAAVSMTMVKSGTRASTQANSKIRLGLIGCGMRGKWIADLFVKHNGYQIVGAADYFQDRVDEFGDKFGVAANRRYTSLSGYKRLLEQGLDAVAVETPPYFHPEQAAAGVDAGVHVIVAKPAAVDVPGALLIRDLGTKASAAKRCFFVDFQPVPTPSSRKP